MTQDTFKLEVGKLDTSNLTNQGFTSVNFSSSFGSTPVIFSQVQTNNDTEFVRTRQNNISSTGFSLAMEEEEALQNGHALESVGWLALDAVEGNWDGHLFEAGSTGTSVNQNFSTIALSSEFAEAPELMAAMASYNGSDPAGVRYRNLGTDSVDVKIEEDQSHDTEVDHANEVVNFLALEGEGLLTDVNGTVIGEFGRITNFNQNSQTIDLQNSYTNPVVFLPTLSYNGADPSTTRITAIDSDSFTTFLEEAEYKDGSHTTEDVSYFVFEAGSWELGIGEQLSGSSDDDLLVGGLYNDIIEGGSGDDIIVGKEGGDVVFGDGGADYFWLTDIADGGDTVQDFNSAEGDRLVLSATLEQTANFDQLAFDSATGTLSLAGNDLVTLQNVTSLDLETDIIVSEAFGIEEHSENGTVVGSVAIANPASSNAYQIVQGNSDGIFAIDSLTGELSVADSSQLDRETVDLHQLFVEATDASGQTLSKYVTVHVSDVNEAPSFSGSTSFSIGENPHDGAVVGTVSATDPEADTIAYKIVSGNERDAFTIDENTGEITIADGRELDYETQNSYTLTLKAIDARGETTTTDVAIAIEDGNEAPEIAIDDDETFIFHDENNNNGTIVARVPATDENGQNPIFSVVGGTGQNYFDITVDGKIIIADAVGLRSDGADEYNLNIQVADGFNQSLTDEVTVVLEKSQFTNVIGQYGTDSPFNPIDVGDYSHPTFADIDRDGDMDAFVGRSDGTIAYFSNNNGSFVPDNNLNPLKSVNLPDTGADPTFADIDNDGDLDAIIGGNLNEIYYYQNNNGSFVEKTGSANPFDSITGFNPSFADIDEDGDLDAFIPEGKDSDYSINYYRNDGGTFTKDSNNNPFQNNIPVTPDVAFADIDGDGDTDAAVGANDGKIKYFRNDNGIFNEQTGSNNPFNSIDVGDNARPSFADIDDDGYLDLVVGSNDGKLAYYKGTQSVFSLDFSSAGQSVWDSGSSTQLEWNWSPLQDLIGTDKITWDITPSKDFGFVEVGAGTYGGIGLNTGYAIDSGSIDSELPVDVWVDLPESISSGQTITLSSGFSLADTANFETTTPRLSAYLDFLFEIYAGGWVTIDYKIDDYTYDISAVDIDESFNFQFDTEDMNFSFDEIENDSFTIGSFGYETGGFGDISGYTPNIDIEGDRASSNSLSGYKSDLFLDASLDLDKVLLTALSEAGIPYLSAAAEALDYVIEGNLDLGLAYANWNLFDASFTGDFYLAQDLDLTVDELTGELNVEGYANPVPFTVGTDLQITPQDTNGDGKVDITGTVNIDPILNNTTSVEYELDIPLTALEGSAGYDVSIWPFDFSDDVEFGPVWSDNIDINNGSFDLYSSSFDLGGFNTAEIDFSIPIA
ncbi:MAG: hypothetical protein D6680_03825 [Cyanobacteria bacterium J007]|nr:MAG: hypothetical protein D6680_03825 [Cyanobacteria bacterium J007]